MKRKISILTLTLVFFGATTGLPVALHFCEMMDMTSSDVCEMHKTEEKKLLSCCEDGSSDYPVKLTSENLLCCQTEFVYNKVKDDFLSFNSETSKVKLFTISFVEAISHHIVLFDLNSNSFYSDSSPPSLNNNYLYLTNSSLLI